MKDSNKRAAPPHLRRVAREARKLAMECLEGTAPELGVGERFVNGRPVCVGGHLLHRAKLPHFMLGYFAFQETISLFSSNDGAKPKDRHAAVVFPLLDLADALEDASKTPKENP